LTEAGPEALEVPKQTERAGDIKEGGRGVRTGEEEDHDVAVKDTGSKHTDVHGKEKHVSLFSRFGTKHTQVAQEQQEGYDRAEKHVSLALTSILSASTIKELSPVGETLLKAGHAASSIGRVLSPVIQEGLTMAVDALGFVPLPGLEVAAKALLGVWEACQAVDTNRRSSLRLAERCATLLYSVRLEIEEAGEDVAKDLAEPLERLCDALNQIHSFLQTQAHRSFLKRYLRRQEIAKELMTCNRAVTDVAAMFRMSIQIRTLKQVHEAADESRRFAEEAQHQLEMEHQLHQFQPGAIALPHSVQSSLQAGNALGLTMGHVSVDVDGDGGYATPPPMYGSPLPMMGQLMSLGPENEPGTAAKQSTPTPSMMSFTSSPSTVHTRSLTPPPAETAFPSDAVDSEAAPLAGPHSMEMDDTVLHALAHIHNMQNESDTAADVAALRRTLTEALNSGNDAELLHRLQVGRGEIPEAVKTLRRVLESMEDEEARERFGTSSGTARRLTGDDEYVSGGETEGYVHDMGRIEMLDREFMESGIDAMGRLSHVGMRGNMEDSGRAGAVGEEGTAPWNLANWTITRYEVDRTRKIGIGFFSDVYLGRWRGRNVALKVLAPSTPRSLFVHEMNTWRSLKHPNVLPLYGASSAVGDRPWFFVSKFCSGGNLVEWLKRARARETEHNGLEERGREVGVMEREGDAVMNEDQIDLLRCMHQIAKGMEYLHGREVVHGDLKAANVLVGDTGRCLISDFGHSEMKSEASRLSEQPVPRGTLRWQAPELLLGDGRLTNAVDTYAFAICCVEILGMGDLPWAKLDDAAVASLVLDRDQRPPLPKLGQHANVATMVEALVHSCWARNHDSRPPFVHIVASLAELRRRQGQGGDESPLPLSIDDFSDATYRHRKRVPSPDMHPMSLPFINAGSSSLDVSSSSESPAADEYYETTEEITPIDVEEETSAMQGSPDILLQGSRRLLHSVAGVGQVSGQELDANFSGSVIYTPLSHYDSSEVLSLFRSSPQRSTTAFRETEYNDSPPPAQERQMAARSERRYRILMQKTHTFHNSLTLPLWSPTRVELGAVGYLSKPDGQFITLFNALEPSRGSEHSLRDLQSMYEYGDFSKYGREENTRNVVRRSLDTLPGFLTFKTRGDGSYSEKIVTRYSFPLDEGRKSAGICTEKTMYRFFNNLDAPRKWFQHHVDAILEVYAPHHPIEKEDLFLVTGALDAPDYALFVSHTHSEGQVHFNVFADKRAGKPWGTFTTEHGARPDVAGPSHREAIPGQTMFASKVSTGGGSEENISAKWDTLMLARLRFMPDVEEPTLL
jgi:serine/threonine protein kinase